MSAHCTANMKKVVKKVALFCMTLFFLGAGMCDLWNYKIPNGLIAAGWLCGLIVQGMAGGLHGCAMFFLSVIVTILVAWPLYFIHAIGAGDIKLLSVIGGMHGLIFLREVAFLALLLAGAVSIVKLFQKNLLKERLAYFGKYMKNLSGVAWQQVWQLMWKTGKKQKVESYYDAKRDGYAMVIPLAPIVAAAYYLIQLKYNGMFW